MTSVHTKSRFQRRRRVLTPRQRRVLRPGPSEEKPASELFGKNLHLCGSFMALSIWLYSKCAGCSTRERDGTKTARPRSLYCIDEKEDRSKNKE